jgi:hypothetical protein
MATRRSNKRGTRRRRGGAVALVPICFTPGLLTVQVLRLCARALRAGQLLARLQTTGRL